MPLKFVPDVSQLGSIELRPYMIEVAWDYCHLLLTSGHQRGNIERALAALAIEVVLKSFNSRVSANGGSLDERYAFDPSALPAGVRSRHDLRVLADAVRQDLRTYLFDHLDGKTLDENRDAFTKSRYYYERAAPSVTSGDALKLAVKLVCKVVYLYKQRGCTDPFIRHFDVDAVYFTHVERWFIVRTARGHPDLPP